jgi:signal peptidase I
LDELTATEPSAADGTLDVDRAEDVPVHLLDDPAQLEDGAGKGKWHLAREIIETIVLTVVIFTAINFVSGRFRIEGPSMMPSLNPGQYLIINKLVYKVHPPARGDIVVFHHPRNPDRELIKRVVGVPGDVVEVQRGAVYVNGTQLDEPYVLEPGRYSGHYELGSDEFFVLGDNRPNSDDSRNWGTVKGDQIVGKAWLSYWPPKEWGAVPHSNYPDGSASQGQGWGSASGS